MRFGRPPGILSIAVSTALLNLGLGLVAPVLPDYARAYGVSPGMAALLLASFAVGRLIAGVPGGRLADRFAYRPFALLCALVVAASALVAALRPPFSVLLGAQVAQGAASTAFLTASFTYLIGRSPPDEIARAIATLQAVSLVAYSFSPLIAGLAAGVLGLSGPFIVATAGGVVAGLLLSVALSADGPRPGRRLEPVGSLRPVLRLRAFRVAFLIAFGSAWAAGAVRHTLVPIRASDQLGLDAVTIGWLLSMAGIGQVVALIPAAAAMDRRGRRPLSIAAMTATAIVVPFFLLAGSALTLGLVLVVSGLARGPAIAAPVSIVADIAPEELRGTSVGAVRLGTDLARTIGPLAAGLLVDHLGIGQAFGWSTVLLVVISIGVWALPETLSGSRGSS